MTHILHFFEHPGIVVLAAVLCVPALFPIGRFFFDDFAAFKKELGLDNSVGRFAWLIGTPLVGYALEFSVVAFVGCYILVVLGAYQLLEKLGVLFHIIGV